MPVPKLTLVALAETANDRGVCWPSVATIAAKVGVSTRTVRRVTLTCDEILVLEPTTREVQHPYPDRPDGGITVQCNSYEEVFAEKVRALAGRERPRELYDVAHIGIRANGRIVPVCCIRLRRNVRLRA